MRNIIKDQNITLATKSIITQVYHIMKNKSSQTIKKTFLSLGFNPFRAFVFFFKINCVAFLTETPLRIKEVFVSWWSNSLSYYCRFSTFSAQFTCSNIYYFFYSYFHVIAFQEKEMPLALDCAFILNKWKSVFSRHLSILNSTYIHTSPLSVHSRPYKCNLITQENTQMKVINIALPPCREVSASVIIQSIYERLITFAHLTHKMFKNKKPLANERMDFSAHSFIKSF